MKLLFYTFRVSEVYISSTFSSESLLISSVFPKKKYIYLDDGLSTYCMTKRPVISNFGWGKRVKRIRALSSPYSDVIYEKAFLLDTFSKRDLVIGVEQYKQSLLELYGMVEDLHGLDESQQSFTLFIMPKTITETLLKFISELNKTRLVLLKYHPRTITKDVELDDCKVLANECPAEAYFLRYQSNKNIEVIGEPSTALINAKCIFGFKVSYMDFTEHELKNRFGTVNSYFREIGIEKVNDV